MMNTIIYSKVNTHRAFLAILDCKIEVPSVCINFPENIFTYFMCRRVNNSGLSVRHRFVGD